LEEENSRLKKLVADLSLDKHILQEVPAKKSKARAQASAGELGQGEFCDHQESGVRADKAAEVVGQASGGLFETAWPCSAGTKRNYGGQWRGVFSKVVENGFIESFNGKLRDECLNTEIFLRWMALSGQADRRTCNVFQLNSKGFACDLTGGYQFYDSISYVAGHQIGCRPVVTNGGVQGVKPTIICE
jgi:hypothetical protein